MINNLDNILIKAIDKNASDVHIKLNDFPIFRLDGSIERITELNIITKEKIELILDTLMGPEIKKEFEFELEADFSYSITVNNEIRRFRVNAFKSKTETRIVLRLIPNEILSLEELGLSKILYSVIKEPRGLILITGPTGSGKTTTIASLIDHINQTSKKHIITLEDPIEFVFESKQCLISQREVGQDTKSFGKALKRSLRQDPDVILLGELRDLETIATAVTLAETGHLVLATLHTTSAATTVDRLIDVFPATQQEQIRYQLSETLKCIVCQTLLKKPNGGRVCASEILIMEDSAKASIKNKKTNVLEDIMQTNASLGMHTLEQDLVRLAVKKYIDFSEALKATSRPEILKQLMPKSYIKLPSINKTENKTINKIEKNTISSNNRYRR